MREVFSRQRLSPFIGKSFPIDVQMRRRNLFSVRIAMCRSPKIKPRKGHGLLCTRLVRTLQKIDSPMSDVKKEVRPMIHRMKRDFQPQCAKSVRLIVCAMLFHRQKVICFILSQVDH